MSSTSHPVYGSSSSAAAVVPGAAIAPPSTSSSLSRTQPQHTSGSGSSSSSTTGRRPSSRHHISGQPSTSAPPTQTTVTSNNNITKVPAPTSATGIFSGHSSYATASSDHLTHISTSLSQSLSAPAVLAHMARMQSHFAQLAPSCAAHLADQNAVPILSTAVPSSPALASLSAAFVHAHDTACRMGLGLPLRVTLNTGGGAAVIQTGTYPEHAGVVVGSDIEEEEDEMRGMLGGGHGMGGKEGERMMLVGTVVAPRERLADARIASWGVEDMARKLQRCLSDGK